MSKIKDEEMLLLLRTLPIKNQTVFIFQTNTGMKNEPQQFNISAFL